MRLNSYKIGKLIEIVDERNSYGIREFYGININKEFMPTAADTDGLDERKYKVVRKNRFVYSGMQTGRDKCIRIGLYMEETPIIVSPAYTTFIITREDIVLPEYFFMKFLSKEKDRLGWFYSDSSVRSNLDWDRFCDIDLELPDIEIQKKYVAVYKSMLENQKNYEKGLEDLKIVCDSMLDVIKNDEGLLHKLGDYIEKHEIKNISDEFGIESVKGITNKKEFDKTKADVENKSLNNFLIIDKNEFAYNSRTDGRDMLVLALNRSDDIYLVTSNYNSFRIKPKRKKELLEEYLYTLFKRKEFDRRVRFNSWGSSQEQLSWNDLCDFKVPIPSIEKQKAIASINDNYIQRKKINDRLKEQIKKICPILIKGSLEEAKSN